MRYTSRALPMRVILHFNKYNGLLANFENMANKRTGKVIGKRKTINTNN